MSSALSDLDRKQLARAFEHIDAVELELSKWRGMLERLILHEATAPELRVRELYSRCLVVTARLQTARDQLAGVLDARSAG
jgi:hypothetical protein